MTCQEARSLLGACRDGEITDVVRIQEIEGHIADCPDCAREMEALATLSVATRSAPYFSAPKGLEERIRAKTGVESFETKFKLKPKRYLGILLNFGLAAAFVLVAFYLVNSNATARFERDLVAGHLRSLQASHIFDVASTDQHTVKPWFQGKLDFAPDVPELKDRGFPLLGGRLDYVNRRPTAALVYGHGKHFINVFVMHSAPVDTSGVEERDGFRLVQWHTRDLDYWAVSDINGHDLGEFAKEFQLAEK